MSWWVKKLGEMSFRGKCQREKRGRENCHLGRNILRPPINVLGIEFRESETSDNSLSKAIFSILWNQVSL